MLGQDDEAALPSAHILAGEDLSNRGREGAAPGLMQAHEEDSAMRAGLESPHIREIQILRDEEPSLTLSSLPDPIVDVFFEAFVMNGMHVMPQTAQIMNERCR